MGTINRGNKTSAGGGTAFVDGTTIEAAEVNTDFDQVYAEFNGNIENVNVDAAADVALTKLGDHSSSNAVAAQATDPGVSGAQALATDLTGELERLRFILERGFLEIDAVRVDGSGTTTTYYGDLGVRGPNIMFNPNFTMRVTGGLGSATPPGWTLNGGITINASGSGTVLYTTVTPGTDFMSYTIDNPPDDVRFLIGTLIVGDGATVSATLTTVGADATSDFRDITLSELQAGFVNVSPQYAVIQSSGADIEIRVGTDVAGQGLVAFVGIWQLPRKLVPYSGALVFESTDTATQGVTTSPVAVSGISTNAVPDAWVEEMELVGTRFGNSMLVTASVPIVATGTVDVIAFLRRASDSATIGNIAAATMANGDVRTLTCHARDMNLPRVTETYELMVRASTGGLATVNGTLVSTTLQSSMQVMATPPGS